MHSDLWTALGSWAAWFFLQALPLTVAIAYEWAKEWQTLLAGLLAIFAARVLVRGTQRSARIMAEAAIRSARIAALSAAPPPLSAPDTRSEHPPRPMPTAYSDTNVPIAARISERLDALRNALRGALAAIPTSDGAIGMTGSELYGKIASFSFDDIDPAGHFGDEFVHLFHELQARLAAMKMEHAKPTNPRQAWEALVRINTLARKLRTKIDELEVPERTSGLR